MLFADLKGSMELLADRDPEEARKLLDPVLERMMEAVHRYEGTVNQVMGDGIMALFGAPLAHEDHAVRACYAALRMQERVKRYAEEVRRAHGRARPDPRRAELRRGRRARHRQRSPHGLHGRRPDDAPGRADGADRRCPGTIADHGRDAARWPRATSRSSRSARCRSRGWQTPVEVYELTGAGPARSRLQAAAARGLTRFVGPGRASWSSSARRSSARGAGHGQVVAVVGEPGVGKSRLVWEFTHSHRTQGWLILETGSVSYGKATPYLPGHRPAQGYFQIESADDAREIREKVTGKLLIARPRARAAAARRSWRCSTSRSRTPRGSASTRPSAASGPSTASSGCSCGRARCSRSWSCSRTSTGSTPRPRRCSTAWSRACPRPGCCSS